MRTVRCMLHVPEKQVSGRCCWYAKILDFLYFQWEGGVGVRWKRM